MTDKLDFQLWEKFFKVLKEKKELEVFDTTNAPGPKKGVNNGIKS